MRKELKEKINNFDLISIHNYPAELSIFPFHKPVVWMCNEPQLYLNTKLGFPLSLKIKNKIFLAFDKFTVKYYIKNIIVADEFNAQRFKEIYNVNPRIINYGIDFIFFSQPANTKRVKRKYNLYNNYSILHVGWLNPFKNQMASIKVVERLKRKIPNIKLILAGFGRGRYKRKLEEYVKKQNLEKTIIFTGHINREAIRELYYACNLLLHPIKPQGGWLSPFEALCAEMPIIVSSEMTASKIIKREKLGIVTDNFIDAVLDIYNNPNKYSQLAKKRKKWVKENLSWDKFCQKMIESFQYTIKNFKK